MFFVLVRDSVCVYQPILFFYVGECECVCVCVCVCLSVGCVLCVSEGVFCVLVRVFVLSVECFLCVSESMSVNCVLCVSVFCVI